MVKAIILPLYDHVTEEDMQELADEIESVFGLSIKPIFALLDEKVFQGLAKEN